jgi:hypothetical protein
MEGRAIAQAVSRWLSTAVARVRSRVWSSGICGGQSGPGAGFLRVLRFPLPIFIPPNFPSSQSPGAGTIGQKWLQYKGLNHTPLAIKENRLVWPFHTNLVINWKLNWTAPFAFFWTPRHRPHGEHLHFPRNYIVMCISFQREHVYWAVAQEWPFVCSSVSQQQLYSFVSRSLLRHR